MEGGDPTVSSVDERIVKMKFDNKQFEQGVKETMGSLDQLERSLQLEGIGQSIDNIGKKIGFLGKIGQATANKVMGSLIDSGVNFINSVMDPILEGGKRRALNIEHAKFMFRGLGLDEDEAMKNANDAVTETAYGLDAAAKAAAMLGASGQKLGDDMTHALRAIAGTAAMANAPYEDMAHIFTTIASNGKLMTYQLRQFSFRGLNMAALLAKELKVSEQQVAAMVTEGEISWEMFYKAVYNQYGEFAAKANETFEGAQANLRAAWARVGQSFFETSHLAKRDLANAMMPLINEFNKNLTPFKEAYAEWKALTTERKINFLKNFDMTPINLIVASITNLARAFMTIQDIALKAWAVVFPKSMEKKQYAFFKAVEKFTKSIIPKAGSETKRLHSIFKGLFSIVGLLADGVKFLFSALKTIVTPFLQLFRKETTLSSGSILDFLARIGEVIYKFREWVHENKYLDKALKILADSVSFVVGNLEALIEKIKSSYLYQRFTEMIQESVPKIKEWLLAFKDSAFMHRLSESVQNMIPRIKTLYAQFKETDIYKRASEGVRSMTNRFKEWFHTMRQSGGFQKFWKSVKDTFKQLGIQIAEFFRSPSMKEFGKKVQSVLLGSIDSIKATFKKAKDWIVKFFKDIRDEAGRIDFRIAGEKIKELFVNIWTWFSNTRKNITGALSSGFKSFKNLLGIIGDSALTVGDKIGAVFAFLRDFLTDLNLSDVSQLISSIVMLKIVNMIKNFLLKPFAEAASGIVGSIKSIFVAFVGAISSFSKSLNKYFASKSMAERSKAILNFAIAIGILAGSLWLLSTIPPDDLKRAGIALGLITAAIAGMYTVIMVFQKQTAAYDRLFGRSKGFDINPILQIALSLLIVVIALRQLTKLQMEGLGNKLLVVFGVIIVFMGIALILQKSARVVGEKSKLAFVNLIALAVSIYILVGAIKKIAKLDIAGAETKILGVIGLIALIFASTRLAGKNASQAGTALLGISVALWLFVVVIKKIAKIPEGDLFKGMHVISQLIAIISIMVAVFALAGWATGGKGLDGVGKTVLGIAAAILILVFAIKTLGKMDKGALTRGTLAVGILLVILGAIVVLAKDAKEATKTVIALAVLIGLLMGTFIALTALNPDRVLTTAIAMSLLMGVLAGLLFVIKGMDTSPKILLAIGAVLLLVGGISLIVALLLSVPQIDRALEVMTGLSEVMLVSAAVALAAQFIDPALAAKGAVGISLAMGIIGGVLALVGYLDKELKLDLLTVVERGGEIMAAIAGAIGEMIGSFISGIGVGLSNGLPKIGANISDFAKELEEFIEVVSKIPSDFATKAGNLASGIIAMIGANLIDGLTKWFVGDKSDLVSLGKELAEFAPYLSTFLKEISTTTTEDMDAAGTLMSGFASLLNALPTTGGWKATILGESEGLGEFGNSLTQLANGIIMFQMALKLGGGIDEELVKQAVWVGETLGGLEASLPPHGGLVQQWTGDQNMGQFAAGMQSFAFGVVSFFKVFDKYLPGGIDEDLVEQAVMVGTVLAELEGSLPPSGGVVQFWSGNTTLEEFASRLIPFALGLVTMDEIFREHGHISINTVQQASFAAKTLGALEAGLPPSGGVVQFWSGNTTLGEFANRLIPFAAGIVGMNEILVAGGGIDQTLVNQAKAAAMTLAAVDKNLPDHGGMKSWWSGDNDLGKFGAQLVVFGAGMYMFWEAIKDVPAGGYDVGLEATKKLIEISSKLEGNVGGLKAIWSQEYSFKELGTEILFLGSGLVAFAAATAVIDPTGLPAAFEATEELIRIANTIDRSKSGLIQSFWSTEYSFKDLGTELLFLSGGLVLFSEAVKDIKIEDMTAGLTATEKLVEISNKLQGSKGGLASIWNHEYSFTDLGKELKTLGEGLADFSKSINEGVDMADLAYIMPILTDIVNLTNLIGDIESDKVTSFSNELKALGQTGVDGFISAFSESSDKITSGIDALFGNVVTIGSEKEDTLKASINLTFTNALSGVGTVLQENTTAINTEITTMFYNIAGAFTSQNTLFKERGQNFMTHLKDGIVEKTSGAVTVATAPISKIIQSLTLKEAEFKTAGKNAAQGFIDGIKSKNTAADTAGYNLGKSALKGAERGLKIQSPSKELYKIGILGGQGLVNALGDSERSVEQAGEDMAFAAAYGLMTALALIQSTMDDELGSPTIRPVLDLTDVRNTARELDNLMGAHDYSSRLAYSAAKQDTQTAVKTVDILTRLNNTLSKFEDAGTHTYDVKVQVEGDGLSYETIKEMAQDIEREIKLAHDRARASRGEAVSFG